MREVKKEKARRKLGNKVVQKYGTIEVGDGRLRIISRNEKETEVREESSRKVEERKLKNYVEDVVKRVRIHYKLANKWPHNEAAELTTRWKDYVTKCAPYLHVIKHLPWVWEDEGSCQS
jgi:hypothetical protein